MTHLERSGIGGSGGHNNAVPHGLLIREKTHKLGDGRTLLAYTNVPSDGKNQTLTNYRWGYWRDGDGGGGGFCKAWAKT